MCTCFIPTLSAQFSGGEGDGMHKSSTIQLTLNGSQINPLSLYRGGFGDGQDKNTIIVSLSGANLSYLYAGGNGDGNTKSDFNGTLGGIDLTTLYLGGISDGHSKDSYQGVLDGSMIDVLYMGGISDGHSKFSFSGLLDGVQLAQLYEGGIGDGSSKLKTSVLLNGEMLSQLYSGGIGDGHDKEFFSGVLDGSALSALYSGGVGDGFSKNMIQYIFDFPGCTFVVNTDDNGFGSLRYAIECAAPGDTIEFSPLLIEDIIGLTSGPLVINKDLYVNGNKSANLSVDGGDVERTFQIDQTYSIVIKGLKIIAGINPMGSAIHNEGILTLLDVDIYYPAINSTTVVRTTLTGSLNIDGTVTIQEN